MEATLEPTKETAPKKRAKKTKAEKNLTTSVKNCNIGLEIKAQYDKLMAAREKTFYKLADENGEVRVKVDACGCNIIYKSVTDFPSQNVRCLCKAPTHFLVKYTVID